jgi:hypothetical protein
MVVGKELLLLRGRLEMSDCNHHKEMSVERGNDLVDALK